MRHAYVDGVRASPAPGLRGICQGCGSAAVSKCGKFVGWHWAHKSRTHCDPWWENETEWHLTWKNRFPSSWQEVVLESVVGERHIADVRTPDGVVIEFQRSTIRPEEVQAREEFYQRMVWVVDGTKNESDATYFGMSVTAADENGFRGVHWMGRGKIFHRWMSQKPVFIDFGDRGFWRVCSFDPISKSGVVLGVNREAFAQHILDGADFSRNGGPASRPGG